MRCVMFIIYPPHSYSLTHLLTLTHSQANGHGLKSFACGDSHEGEYTDDKRHGYVVKCVCSVKCMQCSVECEVAVCRPTSIVRCDAVHVVNNFTPPHTHTPSSYGVYKWARGDCYEGGWLHGRMTGQGKKTLANGDSYEGEWLNDSAHGRGGWSVCVCVHFCYAGV
jgi:hypothetical protein